jgi:cytochrome c-type biogenesis protein CcmH/NrfG
MCKNTLTGIRLNNVKYVYLNDGARAKDPNTAFNDIEILQKALKENPENPRNFFYLARSYMRANPLDLALNFFKKRSQMGGSEEEIFESRLMIARIQQFLSLDYKIIEDSFFKAYLNSPHRLEPLYYLVCKLCERNAYEKAYEILSLAMELPRHLFRCHACSTVDL